MPYKIPQQLSNSLIISTQNIALPVLASKERLCWYIRTKRLPNIRIYSENFLWSEYSDYSVTLNGLNLSNLAGGVVTQAPTGIAAGFVATITIFYV